MQHYKVTSSHLRERGFTVIELVTTILILSLLIAIAINLATGYQALARDREREADIGVIKQSLERHYRTHAVALGASYPATTVGPAGLTTIINNKEATSAPEQTNSSLIIASNENAQTPTFSQYIYQPLNIDDTLCTSAPCVKYRLYYRYENDKEIVVVNSVRQQ